jgi:oligoribonuclease
MLLFLDMETTGLDYFADIPLEVGIILMEEKGMREIARNSWLCRVQGFIAEPTNEFVFNMHTKNGLLAELRESSTRTWDSFSQIDDDICSWVERESIEVFGTEPGTWYLAGSSVHFDRRFAERRFPRFNSMLHHRHFDVSSIKMLSMLEGESYEKGEEPHRALADLDLDIAWVWAYKQREMLTRFGD